MKRFFILAGLIKENIIKDNNTNISLRPKDSNSPRGYKNDIEEKINITQKKFNSNFVNRYINIK
jgi:hypothetical protein|tara:strand:+ start:63 stop:254 length:192 start_codon:yes stop_codon:yes gene_type:complete